MIKAISHFIVLYDSESLYYGKEIDFNQIIEVYKKNQEKRIYQNLKRETLRHSYALIQQSGFVDR